MVFIGEIDAVIVGLILDGLNSIIRKRLGGG